MNAKPSGLRGAAKSLPKPVVEAPQEPKASHEERGRIKQTLYLPPGVHEQLRQAAFAKRVSMQEVARQAFNLWFAQVGLPSWEEAKRIGEEEAKRRERQ